MNNRKSIHSFRNAKIVQLVLLSVMEFIFFVILITNEELGQQIYTNKALFTLCAITWILMIVNFAFLLYDFHKLRAISLSRRAEDRRECNAVTEKDSK